jgi:hypothetical protein
VENCASGTESRGRVFSGGRASSVGWNYFAYNFIKIHHTLRVSPAMAARY